MLEWLGNFVTNPMTWVAITAAVHFGFMYKEMCDWVNLAPRVAGLSPDEDEAKKSRKRQKLSGSTKGYTMGSSLSG